LRQAPLRREKLGEYDSAAVTWILFPFFQGDGLSPATITFSTFCIMLRTGIEQFVGFWVSKSGYRLRIRKVRKTSHL